MPPSNLALKVRHVSPTTSIIDIAGEVSAYADAETVLMDAYLQATRNGAQAILLDFTQLEYMNSSGIGLLVTLLIRAQRHKQQLLAYGLSEHYRQIFALTRLDEAIALYDNEAAALAAVSAAATA